MVVALICGGGNGAHVAAGIGSSQPGVEARVLSLYSDEAERWNNAMKHNDFTTTIVVKGKDPIVLKTRPSMVSKDPGEVTPDVDLIIFMVPAFAHEQYLKALKPFIRPGMVLVGCPGQAGFEFAVWGILGEKAKQVSVMSYDSLPWACRLTQFGSAAEVLGTKNSLAGAVQKGSTPPKEDPTSMMQKVLGPSPELVTRGHLLGISLMGVNAYVHPAILYGQWSQWDGKPLDAPPLFYNGLGRSGAQALSQLSDEVMATAKAITAVRDDINLTNVEHIFDWYLHSYPNDIVDKTDLYTSIRSNGAYTGLTHPCVKTAEGKYTPDFGHRYLMEDLPFGLVVLRGVASVAGVPTPTMDKVITWAQGHMGKEYLKDGQLSGKDVSDSRSPQKYGFTTLESVLGE